jgi:hypothetical protein
VTEQVIFVFAVTMHFHNPRLRLDIEYGFVLFQVQQQQQLGSVH